MACAGPSCPTAMSPPRGTLPDVTHLGTSTWRTEVPPCIDSLTFDYPRLLHCSYAMGKPLNKREGNKKVAVIGAGASGLAAARELARAGYHVDVYEARDRLGGRLHSHRVPSDCGGTLAQMVSYEMGAMRLPFFNVRPPKKTDRGPGPYVGGPWRESTEGSKCMAEFYTQLFEISTINGFSNPGVGDKWVENEAGVMTRAYPGTDTALIVGDFGVDVKELYGLPMPTRRVVYRWPGAATADNKNDRCYFAQWPRDDELLKEHPDWRPRLYHKGKLVLPQPELPNVELSHTLPAREDADIIPTTFSEEGAEGDLGRNMTAWKAGVCALRTTQWKNQLFMGFLGFMLGTGPSPVMDGKPLAHRVGERTEDWGVNSAGFVKWWEEKVSPRYQNITYGELLRVGLVLPEKGADGVWRAPDAWYEGNLGGYGCHPEEVYLYGSLGSGDGPWKSLLPGSALYILRCANFFPPHQLIVGCLNDAQTGLATDLPKDTRTGKPLVSESPFVEGLEQAGDWVKDSSDDERKKFAPPSFCGVASIAESMMFKPLGGSLDKDGKLCLDGESFYDRATKEPKEARRAGLYTSREVCLLEKKADGKITLGSRNALLGKGPGDEQRRTEYNPRGGKREVREEDYDYVVCSLPIWNLNVDIRIEGFSAEQLPTIIRRSPHSVGWHVIAKVAVALKEPYWKCGENDKRDPKSRNGTSAFGPQCVVSDRQWTQLYGVKTPNDGNGDYADDGYPKGGYAILAYVWGEEAQKIDSLTNREVVDHIIEVQERQLAERGLPSMKWAYQDLNRDGSFQVLRWQQQRYYHGCGKTYKPGSHAMNSALLAYNSREAKESNLYFAGEAFTYEGGWTEPGLRQAIDATVSILHHDDNLSENIADDGGVFNYEAHYKPCIVEPMGEERSGRTECVGPQPMEAAPRGTCRSAPGRGRSPVLQRRA
eukprot:TRINITY_DN798_c0_g7_i1.p1 TRINITY_DN798_c0_g7~~TRINITY_DN798_c0_g7_i1.p1  ORF type:complete len:936 (+),score=380.25 TRINITY_DN798_c0_g7_i1:64-2871(+)